MKVLAGHNVPIKLWTDKVGDPEQTAIDQLRDLSKLPFVYKHLAVMPDVHAGIGSTVGTVIATKGAIIPAAVGVDIGCGMMALKTSLSDNDIVDRKLPNLYDDIHKAVPTGIGPGGSFKDTSNKASKAWKLLQDECWKIEQKHPKAMEGKALPQLGTLGSGNHFIELCLDQNNDIWVMLHSGSRGIGNTIGRYFTDLAMKDMEKYFITLPNKALGYLVDGSENFNDYIQALNWAQLYAMINRELMMDSVLEVMKNYFPPFTTSTEINCHHNYAAIENHFGQNVWVTRKGAIRAREGDFGIIPGSMGAKSYIVSGKGNKESFTSCSHGAGRKMSRAKAKSKYTVDQLVKATEGVVCDKTSAILDEIPQAYKKIDAVMESQTDLVEVVYTLKQFLNVKGT